MLVDSNRCKFTLENTKFDHFPVNLSFELSCKRVLYVVLHLCKLTASDSKGYVSEEHLASTI